MFALNIYRNDVIIASPEIDEQTTYISEWMGADKVQATFVLDAPIYLNVGDYVLYNNKKYKLTGAVSGVEIDEKTYRYTPVFYGEVYDMYRPIIKHLRRTKFSYTGTPLALLGLVVDNLNERQIGWSIGDVELIDEPQTFNFDQQSCRVALSEIAEKFELEWYVDNKKIYMKKSLGTLLPVTLKYGRGKGLVQASRQSVEQDWATIWYGYGGNKNLPENYRDGLDRLTFDPGYIERNVNLYGDQEGSVTFEDVYPKRTGVISAVDGLNKVYDIDIDFEIKPISDSSAKIVFLTGDLGGEEFVITGWDNNDKSIRFGLNEDKDSGYVVPNESRYAAVGDKYVLVGIIMPQQYVIDAEEEVKRRTAEHAEKNSHPRVSFPLDIDEKFVREMGLIGQFKAGNSVHVVSESLGVNEFIRLQSISFPLVNPAKLTGVVSDSLLSTYSTQERIAKEVRRNKKITSDAQASALFARKTADEIANAAIMYQFLRTYNGDQAVLSGAFVAGNPQDGEVAGINGAGSEPTEVIFWGGSTYANRAIAPYRVQRNGKAYMTDAEIQNGCKVGSFTINGGYLTTSDYSGSGTSGVLISDQGLASRNAGASWIPASTGIGIWGSFFGAVTEEGTTDPSFNVSYSPIWASLVGVEFNKLNSQMLRNTAFCRGVYGSFVTSVKNVGADFWALRWSASSEGDEQMTYDDRLLIVQQFKSGVILPDTPDWGMYVKIKNARGVDITIKGAGTNTIIDLENNVVASFALQAGKTVELVFYPESSAKRWLII
ncbi:MULTISPECIES: phage tail protein [Olivibacter]|uniref:Phage tail protein n=1 Tax=Olivibacter jilunii TaxID=985016 RepID=A0ABW6AYD8_9SPHI